jgi:hypothetical protein
MTNGDEYTCAEDGHGGAKEGSDDEAGNAMRDFVYEEVRQDLVRASAKRIAVQEGVQREVYE